jgi:Uma2 family endonuclease
MEYRAGHDGQGPFEVDQLRAGDRYELDEGHLRYVAPTGGDGARGTIAGAEALDTDPAVESAGIDTGFALGPNTLRAPDVAVGQVPDAPGWVAGAPLLAVEYASTGQDEGDLQVKVRQLLEAGTRYVWVVRLLGPRRVEVHESGKPMRVAVPGEVLLAPGVLQNPVPVQALFDRTAAQELAFRNLLQRRGYSNLEDVRREGREQGREEGRQDGRLEGQREALRALLTARGIALGPAEEARIASCHDGAVFERWIVRAVTARTAIEVLE